MNDSMSPVSRRDAIKAAGAAAAAAAGMPSVHAQSPSTDVIRVGLVGAGGRGTGAMMQSLAVPGSNVKLTAIADISDRSIENALKQAESQKEKVDCPEERRFKGLDGYKQVLDHCDLVILATPPGFRPFHFEAAVKAGKHVFMEKPVCVDAFGARLCLQVAKMADEKKLKVVVGLQRHYDDKYLETLARVRDGLAGNIVSGQVYWNGDRPWFRNRKPEMSELQYQLSNWYHFMWLSGDHIAEQHVHNIDVANWFLGKLPVSAYGVGGLQNRKPDQPTQIYDHHTVTFTYPGGLKINSQCRQFPGGEGRVGEEFQGTKGIVRIGEITDYAGNVLWKFEGKGCKPYQVEHDRLHDAIRRDTPLNDAYHGTTSSFCAVLGRYATYSGKQVAYDKVFALDDRTMPEGLTWDGPAPVLPEADGRYALPMPATFKMTAERQEPVS
ncbi:MAG: Gfo/Idh/MocA family oxidoreductase [Planctomycetaceae bacterium]|nr:Gfo/Idh/MocA family oxidoreductase [Planctomycetaceae bacterium]